MYKKLALLFALAIAGGALFACGPKKVREPVRDYGVEVTADESPAVFAANLSPHSQDLASYREMAPTIRKSLAYVSGKPQDGIAVSSPDLKVTWGELKGALEKLLQILPQLDKNPSLLTEYFQWVPITGGIDYSGYYEPQVRASRIKKPGYEHPIYKTPPDLAAYRKKHGKYYTRREIEEGKVLEGKNLELAWAADPVDVFFLAIQGSGRLIFDDGTQTYINYAAQNGHKYKSSGRIMREKGLLKRGDIFEQREWLKNNPDRVTEILHDNPSFIFFQFGGRGPTGAMGHTVDDWMSLATDRAFIPLGALVAFGVNIPDEKNVHIPMRGIGFAQDVGGAIKRNRIDIFCGSSERSNYVASHLDAHGPAWILLPK